MSRPKRVQFPGACYYLTLRGNNRQDIFISNADRRQFLSALRAAKERHGLKLYAYCLLPQEAHLAVETPQPNLATVMQSLCTAYTKFFNVEHRCVGHVFQGRYRSLVVEKERYLAEITRFIHLQPARVGAREAPWRYQWSSCSAYVEADRKDALVDSAEVLAHFGRIRLKQSVRYLQYLKDRLRSASALVIPVLRGCFVGTEEFAARLCAAAVAAKPKPALSEARRILAEVAGQHGFAAELLLGRVQWREVSTARQQAVHRIWKEARLGVTELSRLFNRTPSSISQIVKALERRALSFDRQEG